MTGTIANAPVGEGGGATGFSGGLVAGLLDTVETELVVAERVGRIVLMNTRARKSMGVQVGQNPTINLFTDLLQTDAQRIFREIESGKHEVRLEVARGGEKISATVQWLPEADWVVAQCRRHGERQAVPDSARQR